MLLSIEQVLFAWVLFFVLLQRVIAVISNYKFFLEVALAATTEANEMPYVLTSTVELVNNDPAKVSDTTAERGC